MNRQRVEQLYRESVEAYEALKTAGIDVPVEALEIIELTRLALYAFRKSVPGEDTVRVFRFLEYTGPRSAVEQQLVKSIHGERTYCGVRIRAVTLGQYPDTIDTIERPFNAPEAFTSDDDTPLPDKAPSPS